MNNFTMGAGQVRDSYSGDQAAKEEAAHSERMRAASAANVTTFTDNRATPAVSVDRESLEGETEGDRVTDSLKISAGGTDVFNTLFAFAEERGDKALISQWNATVEEAVNGETAVKRHNAHSRAEAILSGLKESYARAHQSKDDGPQIDVL